MKLFFCSKHRSFNCCKDLNDNILSCGLTLLQRTGQMQLMHKHRPMKQKFELKDKTCASIHSKCAHFFFQYCVPLIFLIIIFS